VAEHHVAQGRRVGLRKRREHEPPVQDRDPVRLGVAQADRDPVGARREDQALRKGRKERRGGAERLEPRLRDGEDGLTAELGDDLAALLADEGYAVDAELEQIVRFASLGSERRQVDSVDGDLER
jgi:hypothetical protein